jgi:hypothetical protein
MSRVNTHVLGRIQLGYEVNCSRIMTGATQTPLDLSIAKAQGGGVCLRG